MEIETHLIDRDNHLYSTKVDLFKHSERIVGFKVMCYDRVVEGHLDDENSTKTTKVKQKRGTICPYDTNFFRYD